jgi:hypothetical protein
VTPGKSASAFPDLVGHRNREVIFLSTTSNRSRFTTQPFRRALLAIPSVLVAAIAPFVVAQASYQAPSTTAPSADLTAANLALQLPDSPGAMISSSVSSSADADGATENPGDPQATPSPQPPNARTKHSAHLAMTIAPNEIAQPMSVHEKIVGGAKDSVSLFAATGWVFSAGWTQLTNGSPNYGTDKGAYGQRLGAAAIRNVSEDIFSDCLFAPILHEDPRYYIMGRGNNFFKRAVYAATRTIITRTDSGHTTPNLSLLAGDAAGAALTVTYYPAKNTTFKEAAQTFGGSLGGNAVGFVVTEFLADALQYAHLKKRD